MLHFTFENNIETKKFILGVFGKTIDDEGYIIEKGNKQRILGSNGQEMTLKEFGGIKNGSEIYVKSDIVSLVAFYEKYFSKTT